MKNNLLLKLNCMFVNVKVFVKLVYFIEMLFIEYLDKYLFVRFFFNNYDIDKSDI